MLSHIAGVAGPSIGQAHSIMNPTLSNRGKAILGKRMGTTRGRIDKLFGPRSPIGPLVQKAIKSNHEDILANTHLGSELRGYARILRALDQRRHEFGIAELLRQLNADPKFRSSPSILCPIWRHECYLETVYTLLLRYMFEAVWDQCFFVTIIFGYSPNLAVLEDDLDIYRAQVDQVVRRMSKGRRGVVMTGVFEPDLRGPRQFRHSRDLPKATRDLGWKVEPHGGWVTSGHFTGRAVQIEEFRKIVHEEFPDNGWPRVRFEIIRDNKALLDNLLSILEYLRKHPDWLAKKGVTKGPGKAEHDRLMRAYQSSFHGPQHQAKIAGDFDLNAAIRQWALFMERMGPNRLFYSVENGYAQKWLSESETDLASQQEEFEWLHGHTRIEVHRDTWPIMNETSSTSRIRPPRRRSRKLQYDEEWVEQTDVSSVDPRSSFYPLFL